MSTESKPEDKPEENQSEARNRLDFANEQDEADYGESHGR